MAASPRRVVQARHVVRQRRTRPPQPKLQAANLPDAPLDAERLSRQVYLTFREFAELYRYASANAARMWVKRHPAIRVIRMDGRVLVSRRDVEWEIERQSENLVQPVRDRHTAESRSALVAAKGRAS